MKYKKSILIFTLLVLALFSIACVSAVDVNDTLAASGDNQIINDEPVGQSNDLVSDDAYNASLSDDEIIGVNLEDDKDILGVDPGFYMLDALIKDTKEGETLKLKSDFKYGLLVDPQLKKIEINKAITIDGGNGRHIIDADDEVMIFEINCNDVTLQNIHFKNSKYAAINCTKNVSSITIKECTFENTVGCAVWFSGDAYNCKISGCEFKSNDLKESSYSSVNFIGKATLCSIKSNAFTDNDAAHGSALQFWGDVEKCNISNSVTGKDGAYSAVGGAVTFVGKVSDTIIGGYFKKNTAKYGGAIYFDSEVSNSVIDANFDENVVSGNDTDDEAAGGAIFFNSTVSDTTINGKFTNNKALGNDGWAGAIYFLAPVNNIKIYGEFTSNTAGKFGGALYFIKDLQNSIISANFKSNRAYDGAGGAILINKTDNTSFSGFFQSNSASLYGGAIYGVRISNSNISARFEQNRANNGDGGAIHAIAISHTNITGLFNGNSAENGGAVYCKGIINSTISAKFNNDNVRNTGGAIAADIISTTNIFGEFSENRAVESGGAIFSGSILNSTISAKFIGNRILGNSGVGSAIYSLTARDSIISNCDFIGNWAKGGIVYIESVPYVCLNLILNNNTFLNNNNSKIYFRDFDYISNVNFNWFGNNASNYDIDPIQSYFKFTDWLFLNATLDYSSFSSSNTVDVLFKLYGYNYLSGNISEYDNNQFNHLNFTITSSNGKVDKSFVKLGETVKFTPDNKEPGFVTAKIENAYYTIKIGVKGDFDALQELIDNSESPVINLERSYEYNLFDRMTEGIVINKPVTINGNGFAIDAKGKSRIFNITSDNVEIKNITFLNANSEGRGGAILINASNVSVSNCIFMDNSAGDGVVYFDTADGIHSNLKINNNIFLDNGVCEISFDEIDINSNVDYNWFGNNATNYDVHPKTTNVGLNNWLFLNATSNSSSISIYESLNVLFNLSLFNHSSGRVLEYDNSAFEFMDLPITATKGNVDKRIAKFGENIKFTPTRGGNASVTAKIGNLYETVEFYVIKGDFDLLQDLIDEATSLEINLTRNYTYNGFDSMTEGVVIYIPVTINGNGFVIDAKGKSRVFNVQTTDVSIKNLTIKNANFNGDGGAVYFAQSGRAINCNFTDNNATGNGGAIYFAGGSTGEAINCNFTNNSAINGGAIYFLNQSTVENCNFIDNKATGEFFKGGGAVYFNISGSVENCKFTDNFAYYGGAIYMSSGSVENCNFTNNNATANGGAVYFYNIGTVTNCNFTGNTANYGGAVYFYNTGTVINCNFTNNTASEAGGAIGMISGTVLNCNFTNNKATEDFSYGGAVFFRINGEVRNCNFTDNQVTGDYSEGGAVYFHNTGNVTNCNFNDNSAWYGGAIYFYVTGNVTNCNFTNNKATGDYSWGGAVHFYSTANVANCNFTGNNASRGSAISFSFTSTSKSVSNSIFLNNRANAEALTVTKNENNITITFTGRNNLLNAIYSINDVEVNFTNVTYWGSNGINNTGSSATTPSRSNKVAGQNITVGVVVNDKLVLNKVLVTDENGMIVLDINAGENYFIVARHESDSYYTEAEKTNSTMKFNVNVTSVTTNNKTVNITAKSNIYSEVMPGKLLFILPNGFEINATYATNGTWWAVHTFDSIGEYNVNASYIGLDDVNINNATITINLIEANVSVDQSAINLFVGENATIHATTTPDGLKVNFSTNDYDIVSVDKDGNIISLGEGNATITVSVGDNVDYKYDSVTVNVTVVKVPTEIKITNKTLDLKVTEEIDVGASLNPKDVPVDELIYTSGDENVVKIKNSKIIAAGEGITVVTVSFKGNNKYAAAENKTIKVSVGLNDASVNVSKNVYYINVGDNATIHATATPDSLKVNFSTNDYDIVSVDKDGNIIALGEGNATITVSVGDNIVYKYDSVTVNVTVTKVPVEIKIANETLNLKVKGIADSAASLIPFDAGNPTYISSNESVVIINNGQITAVNEGTATVTVSFAGNEKYLAAKNKTITVNVKDALKDASVTVDVSSVDLKVGENYTIHATTTPDNLNVTYKSSEESVITVDNGFIVAVGEGNATVTVTVGDNEEYALNSTVVNVTVSKIQTEIIIVNETLDLKVNEEVDVGAGLDPKDAPVGELVYESSDESIVKVENAKIIALSKGIAVVNISFKGNNKYAAAINKTIKVSVGLNDADVNVSKTVYKLNVGDNDTIFAVPTPGNLKVNFTTADYDIVSVDDDGNIIALGEGNATIIVSVGDNLVYKYDSVIVNVTVNKIQTEIIIVNETLDLKVNEEVDVGASLDPKDAPVGELVYESSDESIVKVENAKIIALKQGIAVVNVSFKGNNKYAAALNKTIKVSVGLNDADVNVSKTVYKLNVGDNDTIVAVPTPGNLKVNFTTADYGIVSVDDDGNIIALGEGNATIIVSVGDDLVYKYDSVIVNVTVSKIQTEITVNTVSQIVFGDKANITYILSPSDAEGNVTFESSNNDIVKVDSNGEISAAGVGSANITVTFSGNNKYAESSKSIKITVIKANSTLSVDDIIIDYGESGSVNVTVSGDCEINAEVVGHPEAVVNVDNNTISVSGLDAGNYTLSVTVVPDDNHNPVTKTAEITVNKVDSSVDVGEFNMTYGETGSVSVSVSGASGITAEVVGHPEAVVNVDNNTISVSGLDAGNYTLNVTVAGDDNHNPVTKSVDFEVKKADSTLSVGDINFDYGKSDSVNVTVSGACEISAEVVGHPEAVVNVDNNTISVSGLDAGNYTLSVTVVPDDNHNPITKTAEITVNKVDSSIDVDDINLTYGETGSVSVSVSGAVEVTGEVVGHPEAFVNVDNNTISVSGLDAGNYTLSVTVVPDSNHNPVTKSVEITVSKADSSVGVGDIDLTYGESAEIDVKVDGAGEITAEIDNVSVEIKDGKVSIPILDAGNHTLTVTVAGDDNHNPVSKSVDFEVSKANTTVSATTSPVYNSGKDVILTFKDENGNPISNMTVTVDLNGPKEYTTDKKGQISIPTRGLAPKTYDVLVSFKGTDNYNGFNTTVKITVQKATPKLTANKKTFKSSTKSKKYTVTLKDNKGKAIKKAKVTLRVGGKTYKATTNSKGKATFKILKLNKKGTFKATVTYKGNKYFKKVTKKAKITVKSAFKTVFKGSKDSAAVKKIQRALKNNGFYLSAYGHYLKVDGIYAEHTFNAVKEFQKAKGLKVTGNVDEATAKKLKII